MQTAEMEMSEMKSSFNLRENLKKIVFPVVEVEDEARKYNINLNLIKIQLREPVVCKTIVLCDCSSPSS